MFHKGYGTDVNLKRALTFYRKAALSGILEAQYKTGNLYLTNKESYDFDEGVKWLAKSAKRGHPNAAFLLGITYYDQQKYVQADEWLTIAYKKHQVDMPMWLETIERLPSFNERNFPSFTKVMAQDPTVTDHEGRKQWKEYDIERISIISMNYKSLFDSMLSGFKNRVKSTGTRLPGVNCNENVACVQKSLNEMKDSIFVD